MFSWHALIFAVIGRNTMKYFKCSGFVGLKVI